MSAVDAEPVVEFKKKLFYRINEVSRITDLKPYVLRYWETEFPQLAPEKDENDQRRYRQRDIDLILLIKKLLYEEKFTIAGAKQRIASEAASASATGKRPRQAKAPAPASERAPIAVIRPVRAPSGILEELTAIRGELIDLLAYLG
ncbi:MAG: MerR family transcriptional regulator [Candidatus Sumerlaeota bacterium]|nr:MerR family transcriptional regulator [Candidatus Sumerlaeota bacterium]